MTLYIWLLSTLALLATLGLLAGVWLIWEELGEDDSPYNTTQED